MIYPDTVVVISRKSDRARRDNMLMQCKRAKMDCHVLDAIDAEEHMKTSDERKRWANELKRGGVLSTAEGQDLAIVAVHLSHLKACWYAFSKERTRWAVIMEDDVVIRKSMNLISCPGCHLNGNHAQLVWLHNRQKHGREGYVLTRTACDVIRNKTTPLTRPGDLMVHDACRSHDLQCFRAPDYVTESRTRFRSSKQQITFTCRDESDAKKSAYSKVSKYAVDAHTTDQLKTLTRNHTYAIRNVMDYDQSHAALLSDYCIVPGNEDRLWILRGNAPVPNG